MSIEKLRHNLRHNAQVVAVSPEIVRGALEEYDRLKAALEAYPEWAEDDSAYPGFVSCIVCGGGGKINDDGKASKRIPPTHKPDCIVGFVRERLRQAALRADAQEGKAEGEKGSEE